MAETTFYSAPGVLVTSTRFVVFSQTYAMANVTSVRSAVSSPHTGSGWMLVLLVMPVLLLMSLVAVVVTMQSDDSGSVLIGLMGGGTCALVGAGLGAFGIWLITIRDYHVVLATAGGETTALMSRSLPYVQGIVHGVTEAIVHRG